MAMKDRIGKFNTALLDCVRRGSVFELMQSFFRTADNPDLIDLEGRTLLHHAAESNNVLMTRHLIKNNYDVDILDDYGNSPLMLAVDRDSYNTAKLLVEAGANIYLCSDDAASILSNKPNYEAEYPALNRYHEFVKVILRQLKKDCCNDEQLLLTRLRDFGCSLFDVISLGDANVTRLMLENGHSVNECEIGMNETALNEAVKLGDFENVKVLLEFGANVDVRYGDKLPPIYNLYDWQLDSRDHTDERVEILKILIEHGALSTRTPEGLRTPAQTILLRGGLCSLNILMQYNVEYNSFDSLYSLLNNENDDSLEVLRGKSFDVNAYDIDTDGFSLLSVAVSSGSLRKVQFLLEHGANPNAVDDDGTTPLINAFTDPDTDVQENLVAIVRLLLQYGADVQYSYDSEQQTVFDQADNTGEVSESIIAHLAMIESCGVTISDLIRGKIDSRDIYKQHFRICKKQIEEMKETTINGSVTLYKLLTESHLKITRYARDPEFSPKFEEAMRVKRFLDPYYLVSLHGRVGRAIREAKLKEKAVVVMNKLFPCRLRNYTDIFGEILAYLTCDDLKNICKVYDLQSPNLPS